MKNGLRVIDADAHMQDIFARWVEMVEPEYYEPAAAHANRGGRELPQGAPPR